MKNKMHGCDWNRSNGKERRESGWAYMVALGGLFCLVYVSYNGKREKQENRWGLLHLRVMLDVARNS